MKLLKNKKIIAISLLFGLFTGLYSKQFVKKVVMLKQKNDDVSELQKLISKGYHIVDVSYYEPEFPGYVVCTIIYEDNKK